MNNITHRTMTENIENTIYVQEDSAFLALRLIVQNYLRQRWGLEGQEIPLTSRVTEDLFLTKKDLKYLGKYLSVVYYTDLEVPVVKKDTTLQQLLTMFYNKIGNGRG